nr:hypothetical protein [Tanacetum cinerariifolium]GEZ49098.1 hypothetical protein [Tanacetum cinerariifolium]
MDAALLKPFDVSVLNFYRFLDGTELVVGVDLIQQNDNCIPTASDEFPLPDCFPTTSEDRFLRLSKRDAPAKEVFTANEVKQTQVQQVKALLKKKERTVVVTTEDMQKRRNDVKARTTLLLALFDEHQLRFIKYKTAQELWTAILKTFGENEATKKTKKNQLKQ